MMLTSCTVLVLAMLASSVPALAQGRVPLRGTLDDRLAAIEDRLAAIEDRLASEDDKRTRKEETDRLSLESEAKLDRLEVRVIQLESRTSGATSQAVGQQGLLERIRSLERQVARLRSSAIR